MYTDTGVRSPLARVFDSALLAAGVQVDGGERVAAFVDLVRRYCEPGRHYHTLRHLAEAVAALRLLLATEHDVAPNVSASTCMLAVYFHDAVYETKADDNERRSAELAVDVLGRLHCPATVMADVARIVNSTATHTSSAPDEAFVNDADLRVLARPPVVYGHYARRLRLEFAWVGEADWVAGRTAVIHSLLDGPIYATVWGSRHWEPSARANLRRELSELGAS